MSRPKRSGCLAPSRHGNSGGSSGARPWRSASVVWRPARLVSRSASDLVLWPHLGTCVLRAPRISCVGGRICDTTHRTTLPFHTASCRLAAEVVRDELAIPAGVLFSAGQPEEVAYMLAAAAVGEAVGADASAQDLEPESARNGNQ